MPAHNHFRLHIVIVEQYKEEAIEDMMEGNLSDTDDEITEHSYSTR